MAEMTRGVGLTEDAARRVVAATRRVERDPNFALGVPDGPAVAVVRPPVQQWVEITSVTQTAGRYPGLWYQYDAAAETWTAQAAAIWVVPSNGVSLVTGKRYRGYAAGEVSGVMVFVVDDVGQTGDASGGGATTPFYQLLNGSLSQQVANTSAETTLLTPAAPALGTCVAGTVFRFRFCGRLSTKAGSPGYLVLRLKMQSHVVFDTTHDLTGTAYVPSGSLAAVPWVWEGMVEITAASGGDPSAAAGCGEVRIADAFYGPSINHMDRIENLLFQSPASAADTVDVTAQFQSADVANVIFATAGLIEKLG